MSDEKYTIAVDKQYGANNFYDFIKQNKAYRDKVRQEVGETIIMPWTNHGWYRPDIFAKQLGPDHFEVYRCNPDPLHEDGGYNIDATKNLLAEVTKEYTRIPAHALNGWPAPHFFNYKFLAPRTVSYKHVIIRMESMFRHPEFKIRKDADLYIDHETNRVYQKQKLEKRTLDRKRSKKLNDFIMALMPHLRSHIRVTDTENSKHGQTLTVRIDGQPYQAKYANYNTETTVPFLLNLKPEFLDKELTPQDLSEIARASIHILGASHYWCRWEQLTEKETAYEVMGWLAQKTSRTLKGIKEILYTQTGVVTYTDDY